MKQSGHKHHFMSPSVSPPPTMSFGQFGYVTHNPSDAASPTTPSSTSGCDPLSIRLSGSGHGLMGSSVHPNPNSATPLSMDALPNNRFTSTAGGIANTSHHHNSPTTPSAFYAAPPSAYSDGHYCNPSVLDPAAVSLYQTLPNYGFKDATTAAAAASWAGIAAQSAASYYYDPTFTQYGYSPAYGDFNGAARRKNVTRDSTTTLKAWLNEHRKNPYPTKGEKIMLAIITKMTLTQVSTWFANARRRLKKENKMTWEPRNRCDENDEDIITSDEEENENKPVNSDINQHPSDIRHHITQTANKDSESRNHSDARKDSVEKSRGQSIPTPNCTGILIPSVNNSTATFASSTAAQHNFTDKCDSVNIPVKPKIWSLAATAIDDKPKSPPLPPPPPPPLHLAVRNLHSGAFATSNTSNLSGWYCQNAPYPSVSPYGAHYMPQLSGHFQHTPASTSLPPQADTPPQTPPALKLASMQLLNSESGVVPSDQSINCIHPKLIAYRNQQEQMGLSGDTSPPTHIYGSDFRLNCNNSNGSTSISSLSPAAHQHSHSNK